MIRDPSDGSVKEPPKPVIEPGTSGLPKHKREELNRLNESREWMKTYFQRKTEN